MAVAEALSSAQNKSSGALWTLQFRLGFYYISFSNFSTILIIFFLGLCSGLLELPLDKDMEIRYLKINKKSKVSEIYFSFFLILYI
jgi:hypothetical protein